MAVQRILDRAGKPPGGGEAAPKIPGAVTITVNGAVNTNVPVAHQAGGQVTIQVDAPAPETKPPEPSSKDSMIELAGANTLLAFPPGPYLRQYRDILAELDLAQPLPIPLFIRRRV